jgi:hypothetical protein
MSARAQENARWKTGEVIVVFVWLPICANCTAISTGQTVTGQFSSA